MDNVSAITNTIESEIKTLVTDWRADVLKFFAQILGLGKIEVMKVEQSIDAVINDVGNVVSTGNTTVL